jgi:alpha-methylacyl-CoA racemase
MSAEERAEARKMSHPVPESERSGQPRASVEFLAGIRVVTMAQNVPGPLAAARLAQAGARVIKVEPPAGDPFLRLSPAWHAEMHAGASIECLDLKAEDGRARMTALLQDADLFMSSQRPSALARLGLDPDTLRSRVPHLRMIRIFGSLRDPEHAGHDLTYQAQSGLLGDAMPRTLTADVMASERAFAAALAVLRQPPGSVMDVGLVESLAPMVASLRYGLTAPGGVLGGGTPRYRVYAARVGRVAVAALEPHFEARLYEELGLPAGSDPSACFLEHTAADWESWARERDLPIVAVP